MVPYMNPYLDVSGEISIIPKPECFGHFGVQLPLLTTPPPFGGWTSQIAWRLVAQCWKDVRDKTCHMWIHVQIGHLGGRIGLAPGGPKSVASMLHKQIKDRCRERVGQRERERDTYLETLSPLQKPHLNACIDSLKICTTVQILLYDMDIYPKQKCKPMQYTWIKLLMIVLSTPYGHKHSPNKNATSTTTPSKKHTTHFSKILLNINRKFKKNSFPGSSPCLMVFQLVWL